MDISDGMNEREPNIGIHEKENSSFFFSEKCKVNQDLLQEEILSLLHRGGIKVIQSCSLHETLEKNCNK